MKVCGGCGAWIPDEAAHCPNCGRAVAGTPAAPPPVPAAAIPAATGGDPDGVYRRRAEERLRVLGTLYMVAGFLTLAWTGLSFYQNATGATLQALEEIEKSPGIVTPELIQTMKRLAVTPWYLAVTHAVPFLLGVFWAWSGSRLRALEGRIPALVGGVLLLLPCTACCCLTMPLGVYALVTLTRADSELALARR